MSLTYGTLTGLRLAYELDGTVVRVYDEYASTNTDVTASIAAMNDELSAAYNMPDTTAGYGNYLSFVFPETVTVLGHFLSSDTAFGEIQYSLDTTDGLDGTWDLLYTIAANPQFVFPDYRASILTPSPVSSVKGIRLVTTGTGPNIRAFHIYALRDGTSNRLAFWDNVAGSEVTASDLDMGAVSVGTDFVKTFRVKNLSGSSAASVTIGFTDTSVPATPAQVEFSLTGGAGDYHATVNLGTLTAGSVYGSDIYVRRTVAGTAVLGPWTGRISATTSTGGITAGYAYTDSIIVPAVATDPRNGRFYVNANVGVTVGQPHGAEAFSDANIVAGVPTPVIIGMLPVSARPAEIVTIYGHGFGEFQSTYTGKVDAQQPDGSWHELTILSWTHEPDDPLAYTSSRAIEPHLGTFNPEHDVVTIAMPSWARPLIVGFRVRTDG